MADKLTHFNKKGDAHMVDVGAKAATHRVAIATGQITMNAEAFVQIQQDGNKKGDVLAVARLAGIMAAKKTSDLIPLCHPLPLTHINIDFSFENNAVTCQAQVETQHTTGVEMEALTAVNIALLTIYDMCKAVDKAMQISQIKLLKKTGGKSSDFLAE